MNKLNSILGYFPAVLQTVVAVEQAVGSAVPGTAKLQLVLNGVQTAAQVTGQTIDNKTVQGISALVAGIVALFNQTGFFQKASAPTITSTSGMQASQSQQQYNSPVLK